MATTTALMTSTTRKQRINLLRRIAGAVASAPGPRPAPRPHDARASSRGARCVEVARLTGFYREPWETGSSARDILDVARHTF